MSTPRRFLFAVWDGGGNVPPAFGLIRRLVERGHRVRVLGDPTLAEEARLAGADHVPWKDAPHRKSRHPEDDVFRDYEIGNPLTMVREYLESFVGRPAAAWAGETLAALESWLPDLLVSDLYLPATLIAGEKFGIPTAAYCPNIWMLPTPGIPPFGLGWAPARGPLGRLRDRVLRSLSRGAFQRAVPHFNEVRRHYGLPELADFHQQALAADEIHVLTSPLFDFTSPALPSNVHYCGPILDDPSWCEPWRGPWSSGDPRPLVLVAFSSTYQKQAATLRRIVDALSSLPVRAVVTLGPALDPGAVPGSANVVVVRSASHQALLSEASLLVTHCGHGTTMRGLVAGVPLVCLPMGRDQNDTAARVVHRGAGERLPPGASVTRMRRTIQRVLERPSYRLSARSLGEAISSRQGCVDVVASLEHLASRGNSRPASSDRSLHAASASAPSTSGTTLVNPELGHTGPSLAK
jgi:MGT family glycosyltransferase